MTTDKEKIFEGQEVDCHICKTAFNRIRKTSSYCQVCKRGFCEEHGNFRGRRGGMCILCGMTEKERQFQAGKTGVPA